MTSIVKYRTKNHTYLYESTSYRDENGNPRNKRKCIGRIEPTTGKEIYNLEYIDRIWGTEKEPDFSAEKIFSADDLNRIILKDYGVRYLFRHISNTIGLSDTLKYVLPEAWEHVLTLAEFMVASGEPFMYCKYWLDRNEGIGSTEFTSQKISSLLFSITNEERKLFYVEVETQVQ
jgi:hypothetical protein